MRIGVSCVGFLLALTGTVVAQPVSEVAAPVAGPGWFHNQHRTGLHRRGGGIRRTNDTYAWDSNLNTPSHDSDRDRRVYPVAPGTVVYWGGTSYGIGGPAGCVLVEHRTGGQTWWSGYLHLGEQWVKIGERVGTETPIGRVGRAGATSHHLHFALYTGRNATGGLVSFSATVRQRVPTIDPLPGTLTGRSLRIFWRGLEAEQVHEYDLALTYTQSGVQRVSTRRRIPGARQEGLTRRRYELLLGEKSFPVGATDYFLSVRARYDAGWTEWSSAKVKLLAPAVASPRKPRALNPRGWQTLNRSSLSWKGDRQASSYSVYVWRHDRTRWALVASGRSTHDTRGKASYVLTRTARRPGWYYYGVRAEGPGGESEWAHTGFRQR